MIHILLIHFSAQFYFQAISSPTAVRYPQFCSHLQHHWDSIDSVTERPRRNLWCKSFRQGVTKGNDTNNCAEAAVRVFKDIVLQRFKAYNPVALVLSVAHSMEDYYSDRLVDFVRNPRQHILLDSLKNKAKYLHDQNQIS